MKFKAFVCFLLISIFSGITAFAGEDSRQSVKVPVLMYHCVNENADEFTISEENFRKHLDIMKENGFTPVSLRELVDYADYGEALPEKPVCITFDDGYMDNYRNAFPLLKEYNFKATIFAIGVSVGKSTYKNTGYPIIPHFGYAEAVEMTESGLISVQSHTYDMHQWRQGETGNVIRENLLQIDGESLREYLLALENDIIINKTLLEKGIGEAVIGAAYPTGVYNGLVELVMKKNGIRVTFATSQGSNYIVKNDKNSLYSLNRYNIHDAVSPEQLLEWLNEE